MSNRAAPPPPAAGPSMVTAPRRSAAGRAPGPDPARHAEHEGHCVAAGGYQLEGGPPHRGAAARAEVATGRRSRSPPAAARRRRPAPRQDQARCGTSRRPWSLRPDPRPIMRWPSPHEGPKSSARSGSLLVEDGDRVPCPGGDPREVIPRVAPAGGHVGLVTGPRLARPAATGQGPSRLPPRCRIRVTPAPRPRRHLTAGHVRGAQPSSRSSLAGRQPRTAPVCPGHD